MLKRFLATVAAIAASSLALAQGVATVDLLTPAETSGMIPANTRIVDIYFDVASTDTWTAAGTRAITENWATIIYFDNDLNTPGTQPGLLNGGIANKFTTMLSRPRNRDVADRFTNAGADAGGAFDPGGAEITLENELNVVFFSSPPVTSGSPSVDGYIARIAVNVSAVVGAPADYALWFAGPLASVPPGAIVVLRSAGRTFDGGTGTVTYDVPQVSYTDWAMWFIVPEPTSVALLVLGGLAAIRRR